MWISLCCDSAFAHKKKNLFVNSLRVFGDLLCRDLTFLLTLAQSKLPKNPLPTSFGLCYHDHLQSSVKDSHCSSDPTTSKTPSVTTKLETSLKTILFNEHVSNAAHVDRGLSL